MERTPPDPETIRKLFQISGNRCPFPRCKKEIINLKDNSTGYICSIESNEKEQPRFNPNLKQENRIMINNLMLVCVDHFAKTEVMDKKFNAKKLAEIKSKVEEFPINPDIQITDRQISEIVQKYVEMYPSEKIFEGLTEEEKRKINERAEFAASFETGAI